MYYFHCKRLNNFLLTSVKQFRWLRNRMQRKHVLIAILNSLSTSFYILEKIPATEKILSLFVLKGGCWILRARLSRKDE